MAVELDFELFENAYKLRDVTNPNPIKAGKFKFTEDGLYSEIIFGPLKTYKCDCGNLFSRSNAGKRCTKCNVLCDNKELRGNTFARIDLPKGIYIMLPIFKTLVSSIFGSTAIRNLLESKNYDTNKQKPYFYSVLQEKLVKKRKLGKKEKQIYKPVYDITTLHELYRSMLNKPEYRDYILKHMVQEKIADYIFVNFILVNPPDSRPIAKLNNQYQAHPTTAAYHEILKNIKNSFLDRAFVKNSSGYGQTVYKYQNSVNKLYKEIIDKAFQRKKSIVRESLSGKTVETSQRATIIPDPTLPPGSIGLSEESIKKLFYMELLHFIDTKYQLENTDDSNMMSYTSEIDMQLNEKGEVEITKELFQEFLESCGADFRVLFERPPVLYKYNISGVVIGQVIPDNGHKGISQDRVITTNTLIAPMFNMDYDGDSMSVYALTSVQAKEDWKYSYVENNVEFEHNRNVIASPEHESIYAAYMLSVKANKPEDNEPIEITNLSDLDITPQKINNESGKLYKLRDKIYTFGTLVINQGLNTGLILYDGSYLLDKGGTQRIIDVMRKEVGDDSFYTYLHNFNKFLLECSTVVQDCNPTFDLTDFAVGSESIDKYKETLIVEPYIAFHQNDILFKDYVSAEVKKDDQNILSRVFDSGARIKSVQLLKAVSNNGIPTNIYGKAFKENIKNSLLDGLTEEEFFMGGDSARLALAQRQEAIPKGGELQRKFYYATGFLRLSRDEEDCGSTKGLNIKIENAKHLRSLYSRYYMDGSEIDTEDKSLIGTTVTLRTPIFCKTKDYKICTKCFGHKKPQSTSLGSSIGAYISESIIQSVLRTHHFSGAFITNINDDMVKAIKKLRFQSPNKVFYDDIEDINKLKEILYSKNFYNSDEYVEFHQAALDPGEEKHFLIEQVESPFNDDSVKQLNNIVGMIDKNRDEENMYSIEEMYHFLLDNILLPNTILSIYIELVISILYYDDEDIMLRYSDRGDSQQIAIKNVIDKLDPKLAIFHNFSNRSINKVYTSHRDDKLDHMYNSQINCYQ